mmetsp:Transcript_30847/g.47039  ORF Transcript_30847/g.47039 Transcript_30847/m.47039 type:complete len:916 (-) Transcript_30847:61-2808(-)
MSNTRLNPIYVALDSHQYARAAKLAATLPTSNRLGRALLAYAYYKSGQTSSAKKVIEEILDWDGEKVECDADDISESLEVKPNKTDWSNLPTKLCPPDLADETTLDTLSITMIGINMSEMVYKLYAWVGEYHATIRLFSQPKQFVAGLQILVQSDRNDAILESMQALALQMSRISPLYTAWAARTALWQWQFADKKVDDVRLQMLPRLAESLAEKVVEASGTIEDCQLWVQILRSQSKWEGILDILPKLAKMPPVQILEISIECHTNLEQWGRAQNACVDLLRKQSGGQWSTWKSLIACSLEKGGFEETECVSKKLLDELQSSLQQDRTLSLVFCELALVGIQHRSKKTIDLQMAIQDYANAFSSKMSCVFEDLESYLNKFIETANKDEVEAMSNWVDDLRQANILEKGEENCYKLRSLIFSLQVMRKCKFDQLPKWTYVADAWISFPTTASIQKENQPSDELVLLAVDRLLEGEEPGKEDLLTAATMLEMGLKKSSYNPYLKLRLLDVYRGLGACDRCWELFQDLGIKHIQFDSCTYLILPILLEGGLYEQALVVANETLKFHISTISDTSNFISRALENGNWSKADEFLNFQRKRMNNSLTLLQSKGVIMDCAPLMTERVASAHGIFGGDDDLERATRMLREVHNTMGAPSLVCMDEKQLISDNRDLSILPVGMVASTSEEIRQGVLQKKFYHGILLRAVMILDVMKGPKKGKVIQRSEILTKRCDNLLQVIKKGESSNCRWVDLVKVLSRMIVVVTSGMPLVEGDSLKLREGRAIELAKEGSSIIQEMENGQSIGLTIVQHLVPTMALIKMIAKIFHAFGWGKRKKKEIVKTLAALAASLKSCMSTMLQQVESSLVMNVAAVNPMPSIIILDSSVWDEVQSYVHASKVGMQGRLSRILHEFMAELDTFKQTE